MCTIGKGEDKGEPWDQQVTKWEIVEPQSEKYQLYEKLLPNSQILKIYTKKDAYTAEHSDFVQIQLGVHSGSHKNLLLTLAALKERDEQTMSEISEINRIACDLVDSEILNSFLSNKSFNMKDFRELPPDTYGLHDTKGFLTGEVRSVDGRQSQEYRIGYQGPIPFRQVMTAVTTPVMLPTTGGTGDYEVPGTQSGATGSGSSKQSTKAKSHDKTPKEGRRRSTSRRRLERLEHELLERRCPYS